MIFKTLLLALFILFTGCGGGDTTSTTPIVDENKTSDISYNHAPIALDNNLTIKSNQSIKLLLHAKDEDRDIVKFVIVTPPQHGYLNPQTLIYTPAEDFNGYDEIYFYAEDENHNQSNHAKIIITSLYDAPPTLSLRGEAHLTVELGEEYTDLGATANDTEDGNLNDQILINGTVNTAITATYTIKYSVTDSASHTVTKVREVTVVDSDQAPVISLIGLAHPRVELGAIYTDLGATANDAEDGNISDSIIFNSDVNTSTTGTYTITYRVTDSAAHTVTKVRNVTVFDPSIPTDTLPTISLVGSSYITLELGSNYTDLGAMANDVEDGNLTSSIITTGSVNTAVEGDYTLTYSVTDSDSHTVTKVRYLNVYDPSVALSTKDIIDSKKSNLIVTYNDEVAAYNTSALTVNIYHNDPQVPQAPKLVDIGNGDKALQIYSNGLQNAFHILGYDATEKYGWQERSEYQNKFYVSWDSKFSNDFIIYVVLKFQTENGDMIQKDLIYTPSANGYGSLTNDFLHISLGSGAKDGNWHHYKRDLLADLHRFYPNATIPNNRGYINGLAIRGNALITNVKLTNK